MNLTFERLETRPGFYVLFVNNETPFEAVGSINEWARVIHAMQDKRSFRGTGVGVVRDKAGYGFRSLSSLRHWILIPHSSIDQFREMLIKELMSTSSPTELRDGRVGKFVTVVNSTNFPDGTLRLEKFK